MTHASRTAVLAAVLAAVSGCDCGGPPVSQTRPRLAPIASPIDFGVLPVLNEKRIELPVLNLGRAALNLTNVQLTQTGAAFALVESVEQVVGGDTRNLVVVFKPPEEREYQATLAFDTDDVDNAHVELELLGRGSTRAVMQLMPTSIEFGRVPECSTAVQSFTITSTGTADLIVTELAFTAETPAAFSFVGSSRTPATVPHLGTNGLPGQIQLTVKLTAAAGLGPDIAGAIRVRSTDPDQPEVLLPLHATVNRAPVPVIAPLGNGAPGQVVTLDGTGSADPDNDIPLNFKWTLRSRPLASNTAIMTPDSSQTTMRLDPEVPGAYEVLLEVTDSQGVKSCAPARATVVAAPAQKLLVEMFWDNSGTDLDLHVLRVNTAPLFELPDDCHYQNRTPEWGQAGPLDDPQLVRDALTGYGPELFGYVNPIDTTYRVLVVFTNELLSTAPSSKATVRVYEYGVLKAELSKQLPKAGEIWSVADIVWPSGEVQVLHE